MPKRLTCIFWRKGREAALKALTMSCQTPRVGALELVRVQEGFWHTRLQLSKEDTISSGAMRCIWLLINVCPRRRA